VADRAITEDVTPAAVADMVRAKALDVLQQFVGRPMTPSNVEAVKRELFAVVRSFEASNDCGLPICTFITAGYMRSLCGMPSAFVPDDAVLYIVDHDVQVDTDNPMRSLRVHIAPRGQWRLEPRDWPAEEAETSLASRLAGAR
jgi:hypothetical protein